MLFRDVIVQVSLIVALLTYVMTSHLASSSSNTSSTSVITPSPSSSSTSSSASSSVHYHCPSRCTCQRMTSWNDALRLNCSRANYMAMPPIELAANRDEAGVTSGTWYDVILDDNRLYAIDYPKVVWASVVTLSIRRNRLDYLLGHTFCASQKLVQLSLASNHIDIVRADAFRCLTNLRVLDLSDNSLAEVSPDWFVDLVSLTTLRLQFNRLPTIYASSFNPLLSLTSLDLSANQLTHIYGNAFTGLAQLKTLNLSNNPLDNVNGAFGEFSMVDVIDISATHFRLLGNGGGGSASFVDVNVTMVIANRMAKLSLIDRGAFTNMPHTTVIQLANNTALKYVDDQAFINTPMLRELHLNNSALLSLELSVELLRRVEDKTLQVFLTGNQLRCDCRDYLARVSPSSLLNFAALCKSHSSQPTALGMQKQNESCQPRIVHVSEATYDKTVGDSLSLACRSVPKHAVQWSFQFSTSSSSSSSQPLPASSSSSSLSSSLPGDAAVDDRGQLTINFLLTNHQGTYTCHVMDPTGSDAFSIAVRVRSADAAVIFLGSSATSVTVTWRAHVTPGGAPYVLTYRPTDVINATQRVIDIRMPMRSFTVSGLRTSVTYEFCICLRRTASPAAVLPVACENIATRRKDGAYSGVATMQRAVLVGVIGGVLGVVTLVCALSHAVKRYNRRKLLQEQLRGDPSSELYLAGVDFLSAESAPVTYENPAAVDAYDVTNSDDDNDDAGGGGDTDDGEYFGGRTRTDVNHYDDASNFDDYGHPQTSSL